MSSQYSHIINSESQLSNSSNQHSSHFSTKVWFWLLICFICIIGVILNIFSFIYNPYCPKNETSSQILYSSSAINEFNKNNGDNIEVNLLDKHDLKSTTHPYELVQSNDDNDELAIKTLSNDNDNVNKEFETLKRIAKKIKENIDKNKELFQIYNKTENVNEKDINYITNKLIPRTLNNEIKELNNKLTKELTNSITEISSNNKMDQSTNESSNIIDYGSCSLNIRDEEKFDCFPQGKEINEKLCLERGCCWNVSTTNYKIPACYYPIQYNTYKIVELKNHSSGFNVIWKNQIKSPYGNDIIFLNMNVKFETVSRVHIKITDANSSRYETSIPEVPMFSGRNMNYADLNNLYDVIVHQNQTGFAVIRKLDESVIFDSRDIGGFIYSNQFIQISGRLLSNYIYGLGENRNDFLLDTNWKTLTMFSLDDPPANDMNGYGVHPFYINLHETNGNAHGVFLKTSNAMDIILQPTPAITYRVIGGILDFYFFLGPTPSDVVTQYLDLIGYPDLPPYWSLGFHLCRFGYKNLTDLELVIERNRKQSIPLDTVWVDIDYMENHNNFVVAKSFLGLKEYVNKLHKEGLHFVPIVDPGIASREGPDYLPYIEGVEKGIFVKNESGLPMEGRVWNDKGGTVFPDFSNPDTVEYWMDQLKTLYDQFEFDGLWTDMNEPSNFLNGTLQGCPTNSSYEFPPYVPKVAGGLLSYKTLCMTGKQYGGLHYDLHSLYGTLQTIATNFVLKEIRNKRSFIISRSTYSGQGKFGGHWTGDVYSVYDDMKHSVGDIMSFNIFGIPMVGADICGFNGNTNPQLCLRWHQVGAFYPFSRNHNEDNAIPQDPAIFDQDIIDSIKHVYTIRYSLLPYLYSLFYRAYLYGETVIRPLFFEFPSDVNTYNINTQFMWGPGFLISPALDQDQTYTQTYLPKGVWYDFNSMIRVKSNGSSYEIDAPNSTIPLFIRGGHILTGQIPEVTTTLSRKNEMFLYVALDENDSSCGSLYWDDGDSLNTWENSEVSVIHFNSTKGVLNSIVEYKGYTKEPMILGHLFVLGVNSNITKVTVDKNSYTKFNQTNMIVTIYDLKLDLNKEFEISWN